MEYSSPFLKLILPILITCTSLFVPTLSKPSIPSSSSGSVSNSGYNGLVVSYGSQDQAGASLYTPRNPHHIKPKRIKQKQRLAGKRDGNFAAAGSESVKNKYSPMLSELEGDNSRSKMKLIRRSRGNNASIKSRANRSGNKSSEKFRASPLLNVVRVRYTDGGKYVGDRPSESTWAFHNTGQTQYNAEAGLSAASSSSSTYGNEEIKYDISNATFSSAASAQPASSSTFTRNEGYTAYNVGGGKSNTFSQKHGRVVQGFNSQEQIRNFLHPLHQPGNLLSSSSSSSSELSPSYSQKQQQQQQQLGEQAKEQYISVPSGSVSSGSLKETGGMSLKKKETGDKDGRKKEQIKGNPAEDALSWNNDLKVYSGSNNDDERNNHNSPVKETRSSLDSHGPGVSASTHYGLKGELSPPHEGEQFQVFYGVHPGGSGVPMVLMGGHHSHHEMNTHPAQVYGNHGKDGAHPSSDHQQEETNEDTSNEDVKGEHSSHASDKLLLAKTIIGTKTLKVGTVFVVGVLVLGILVMALLANTGVVLTPLVLPLALLPVGVIALALFIPLIVFFVPIVALGLAGGRRRKKRSVVGGSKKKAFMSLQDDDGDDHFHYFRGDSHMKKSEMIYFHPPAVKEVNHADGHLEGSLMSSFFRSLLQTGFDTLNRLFESERKLSRETENNRPTK